MALDSIPPANRTAGQTGHVNDHNEIAQFLQDVENDPTSQGLMPSTGVLEVLDSPGAPAGGTWATPAAVIDINGNVWVTPDGGQTWVAGANGGGSALTPVNDQTGTSYTATQNDHGALIVMTNAAANTVQLSSVLEPGTEIRVMQGGTGSTSFVAGTGVTLNTPSSAVARTQWSQVVATATATGVFVIGGDTQ